MSINVGENMTKNIREKEKISDFAADLNSIMKGEAFIEYVDPKVFFQRDPRN